MAVRANSAFAGSDSVLKAFPPQDQNLEQIRGPMIIEGGVGSSDIDRSLRAPVLLPDEINVVSAQESSTATGALGGIDTLNVFHTDNTDADTGKLFYRRRMTRGPSSTAALRSPASKWAPIL